MDWIRRYAVVQMDSNPMYGKSTTLAVYEDKAQAVERAKALSIVQKNICIIENRYASVENLERGFPFDSHVRWASWL